MLPVFGANATGATILSLDDITVDTDQGAAFTADLLTPEFTGADAEFSTLRRVHQAVQLGSSATLKITPVVDGGEGAQQTASLTVSADSPNPDVRFDLFDKGTRFQVKLEVTAHVGNTLLGEHEATLIPRRTIR